ncbi:GMC family oxidoreductase N-terminal domain-containing protein [Duganella violaceipulchra]|uniref:long-chain-alcohol oxidase n=1 Tax=Duganella violaceipulchra TaxID=2849652 RepID=A0AA41H720_9BURK|nr:GMC family oxidoreductase [Duganella violaceicalia]MBV6323227.1 GMC family oxidoreductase [Duganella violaceicalia]MCP2009985.1 choline dehydrogenase-like flavoprotein [Duganella violaceicalia]
MTNTNIPIAAAKGPVPDPIRAGLAAGWRVTDCARLDADLTLEADVIIVGSGAGGGVSAEILALSGLRVLIVEEGALRSSSDFNMKEAEAYPQLYQESAARKTRDKGINILQGRTVGGTTTVNWTSSFRTPDITLAYWTKQYGLKDYTPEKLAPWFGMMEQRLNISDWAAAPNENNDLLRRGAAKLGIPTGLIRRNVNGCWNLGYCGMGCPTNAKQSMLVTTIPGALTQGATLLTRARAERFVIQGDKVAQLDCVALDDAGRAPTGRRITLRAKHYIVAGGAINSPALLLRSGAPDPHGLLGKRTFLHPVVISAGTFEQRVDGYAGAPQTVYSDHFLHDQPIDGAIGYKLEVPPLHPLLLATTTAGFGARHAGDMAGFPHKQAILALLRDGFHADAPGGSVALDGQGAPVLDYPISEFLWDGARRAFLTMAEIQFAAGARDVSPVHESAPRYTSWAQARAGIAALPLKLLATRVVSAHVMGGCTMSDDERQGVCGADGRYHGLANLSVYDGSLFPTSIGANPQLSIYGVVARLASGLAQQLSGKPAARPRRT